MGDPQDLLIRSIKGLRERGEQKKKLFSSFLPEELG